MPRPTGSWGHCTTAWVATDKARSALMGKFNREFGAGTQTYAGTARVPLFLVSMACMLQRIVR